MDDVPAWGASWAAQMAVGHCPGEWLTQKGASAEAWVTHSLSDLVPAGASGGRHLPGPLGLVGHLKVGAGFLATPAHLQARGPALVNGGFYKRQ